MLSPATGIPTTLFATVRMSASWKGIPTVKQGGYKNYQLFNLNTDRAQQHDLSGDMPEPVDRM